MNLEFLVTFVMNLMRVCRELVENDINNLEGAKPKLIIWEKRSLLIVYDIVMSFIRRFGYE